MVSRLSLRRTLLMLLGAISTSIASHIARARSGASAAANTAMISRQAGWSGSFAVAGAGGCGSGSSSSVLRVIRISSAALSNPPSSAVDSAMCSRAVSARAAICRSCSSRHAGTAPEVSSPPVVLRARWERRSRSASSTCGRMWPSTPSTRTRWADAHSRIPTCGEASRSRSPAPPPISWAAGRTRCRRDCASRLRPRCPASPHGRRRCSLPDLPAQKAVDGLVGTVVAPLVEVVLYGAGGRQAVREAAPLASGAGLVQQGVDDLPHVVVALVAAEGAVPGLSGADYGLDQGPALVG